MIDSLLGGFRGGVNEIGVPGAGVRFRRGGDRAQTSSGAVFPWIGGRRFLSKDQLSNGC